MATKKVILRERTKELISFANKVKDTGDEVLVSDGGWFSKYKGKRKYKNQFNSLKNDVFDLEQQVELFEMEEKLTGNPLWFLLKLVLGLLFSLVSLLLWLHM